MAVIIAILVCPVAFIVSVVLLIKAAVKKESKKPALIGIGASFAVFVICIALTPVPDAEDSSGSGEPAKQVEQQEEQPKQPEKPEYSTEFNPEYSVKCGDESIIVNVEFNAPDGAVLELVVFDNDLNSFSDKQEIKDGKARFELNVDDDSAKKYSALLSFQFNADSIVQPDGVKSVFGDYGEKMTGDNANDATVNGEENKGKNGSITFDIYYPDKESVTAANQALWDEACEKIVESSDGLITSLQRTDERMYDVYFSNSWYLLSEGEKQYLVNEIWNMVQTASENVFGEEYASLYAYAGKSLVAKSSVWSGEMKLE